MNNESNFRRWKVRWPIWVIAWGVTGIVLFYAIENARGKSAWEKAKADLVKGGEPVQWVTARSVTVPPDENFFGPPDITRGFQSVDGPWILGLPAVLHQLQREELVGEKVPGKSGGTTAKEILAAFEPNRVAMKRLYELAHRPKAVMPALAGAVRRGAGATVERAHWVSVRVVSQIVLVHAICSVIEGETDDAVEDFRVVSRVIEAADEPVELVSAMIRVAIAGLWTSRLTECLQERKFNQQQLQELREMAHRIDLIRSTRLGLEGDRAMQIFLIENPDRLKQEIAGEQWDNGSRLALNVMPYGWMLQNLSRGAVVEQEAIQALDSNQGRVTQIKLEPKMGRGPYWWLAKLGVSSVERVLETCAKNQAHLRALELACAVEEYRLAHGRVPEKGADLLSLKLDRLPIDPASGKEIQYEKTAKGYRVFSTGKDGAWSWEIF